MTREEAFREAFRRVDMTARTISYNGLGVFGTPDEKWWPTPWRVYLLKPNPIWEGTVVGGSY